MFAGSVFLDMRLMSLVGGHPMPPWWVAIACVLFMLQYIARAMKGIFEVLSVLPLW